MAFGITTFAESPFAATGSTSVNVQVTGQELTIAETSPRVIIDVTVDGAIWQGFEERLLKLPNIKLQLTAKTKNRIELKKSALNL